jgi:hypothetical protein
MPGSNRSELPKRLCLLGEARMSDLKLRKIEVPYDFQTVFTDMYRRGFTDGLPVIPATEDAVKQMLDYVSLAPDEVLGIIPPDDEPLTAAQAAINSVMAGCLPEFFPVLIAAVKAVTEPKFNLLGIQTTTNPVGPVLVINGPVRELLDINSRRGCMGPGRRANATIGRALNLILLNVGGNIRGEVDKSIHGMPGKFTFCFGELEEESPWESLHVKHGFRREQCTVAAFGGQGTQNIIAAYHDMDNVAHMLADAMRCYGNNTYHVGHGNPLVVLNPGHARLFAEQGWSKQRLKEVLFEQTKLPRSYIPAERMFLETVWNDYPDDRACTLCDKVDDIEIVVAGGPEAYHICYIPSFAHTELSIAEIILPKS